MLYLTNWGGVSPTFTQKGGTLCNARSLGRLPRERRSEGLRRNGGEAS